MKPAKAKAKRSSESCSTPSSNKHVIDRDDEESPSALTRKKKKSETYHRSPLTSPFESTSPLSGSLCGAAHHSPLTSPNAAPLPTPLATPSSGTPRPSVTHIALAQSAASEMGAVQSGISTPVRPTTPTHRSTPPQSGVPEKRRKSGESSQSPVRAPLPSGVPETADPSGEMTMASESDIPPSEPPQYPRADSDDVMRSVSPTNRSQRPLPRNQSSSDLDVSDSDNEPTAAELNREAKTMYNRHALMHPRLRNRHSRANSQQMNDDDTPSSSRSALKPDGRSASAVVSLSSSSSAVPSHSPGLGRSITSPTKSSTTVANATDEAPSSSSPTRSAGDSRLRVHGSASRSGETTSAVNRSQSEDIHLFQMTDSEFDVFEGTHVGHDDIMNLEKLEISRNTSNFFPHSFESLKNLKSLKLEDNQMSTLPRAFMSDPMAARKQRARAGSVSIGGVATGSGGQPASASSVHPPPKSRARASTASSATPQNGNSSSEDVPDTASMSSDSALEDAGGVSKSSRAPPDSRSSLGGDSMGLSELKEIVLHQREVERVDLAMVAQRVPQLESLSIANYSVSNFAGATQHFRNVRGLRLRKVGLVSLPMSINNLHILEILDVSYNAIKVLPGTICKLKMLRVVNCSHNQLGILPAALGDMPKLNELDVSFNLLRSLPLNFGKLKPKCKVIMANNPATQHDNNKRAKHRSKRKLFSPNITTPLVPSKGHTFSTTSESKTSADVSENKIDSPQQNSRDTRSSSSEHGGRRRLYKATRRRVSQTNVHAGTDSESDDKVEMGCPSFLRSGSPAFGTINSRVPAGAKGGDGTGTLPGGASSRGAGRSTGRDGLSSTDSLKLVSQSRSDGVQPSKRIKRDNASQDNSRERYSMGYLHYSDTLADGFYDCGRLANHSVDLADLVTMKLSLSENPAIREIILVDSTKDAALAEILACARDVVIQDAPMKARVHMLALFVSDSLGGRTNGPAIKDLCQENIQRLRINNNTNIIRLGDLSHGLCRHRSILFKYLADALDPKIPCSLVRGYRIVNARASAHSWNLVKIDGEEMLLDILEAPHILQNPFPELDFSAGAYIPQFLVSTVLYEEFINNASPVQTVTLEHLKDVYEAKWDKKLGEGSYAKVFDGQLAGSTVAVKVSPCHSYDEHTFARVLREIWIHSSMNHPNIVRFLGYLIRPPQELRVFMERVHGLSLFHVARKRRQAYREHQKRLARSYYAAHEPQGPPLIFNTWEVFYIAISVAKGIAYLHSRNIMHRDLKSDNILMGTAFPLRPQLEDTDMTSQTSSNTASSLSSQRLPPAPRTDEDHPLFMPTSTPVPAPSTAWGGNPDYTAPLAQSRAYYGGNGNSQNWRSSYASQMKPKQEPVLGEDGLPVFDPLTSMTHFHVKVCDFNVSCVAGPGPKELEYVGTLRWIAPEVLAARYSLNHRSVYSHSCDIRSYGMILLEIISGAIPYSEYDKKQGATLESLTQHILKGNLPDVTPYEVGAAIANDPLRAILYRMAQDCLQFEPAKRPTAAAIVQQLDDLTRKFSSSINMYNHRLMRM